MIPSDTVTMTWNILPVLPSIPITGISSGTVFLSGHWCFQLILFLVLSRLPVFLSSDLVTYTDPVLPIIGIILFCPSGTIHETILPVSYPELSRLSVFPADTVHFCRYYLSSDSFCRYSLPLILSADTLLVWSADTICLPGSLSSPVLPADTSFRYCLVCSSGVFFRSVLLVWSDDSSFRYHPGISSWYILPVWSDSISFRYWPGISFRSVWSCWMSSDQMIPDVFRWHPRYPQPVRSDDFRFLLKTVILSAGADCCSCLPVWSLSSDVIMSDTVKIIVFRNCTGICLHMLVLSVSEWYWYRLPVSSMSTDNPVLPSDHVWYPYPLIRSMTWNTVHTIPSGTKGPDFFRWSLLISWPGHR